MNSARGPCDEAILRAAAEPVLGESTSGPWVLAATVLGSSMAFLDGTVVNVALPVIQKDLSASVSGAQWVIEAYLLFLSSLVLVGGSLGDRMGRRRVFVGGAALFAVSSAACGLAPGIHALIAARAAQGIGAALLVPTSLAILGAAFPASARGRAVGTWSALTAIATVIGPVLGGWLVQALSWRAVFFLNLPLAAAVIWIAATKIPESRDPKAANLDLPGAILATVGLAGLVFGLIEAPAAGWRDLRVGAALVVGAAALLALAFVERGSRHPMVPPDLFGNSTFTGANLLTLFLYAALSAAFFFLPFNLIQAQGYSPAQAGAAMLPLVLIVFGLSRWSGAIADRVGPRIPLIAGPAIAALGFLLLALPVEGARYATAFLPALCVVGLGLATTVAPLTTTVLNSVDREREGTASGINNAVARVAGLLAIAAVGIVFSHSFDRSLDRRLSQARVSNAARTISRSERLKLGAAQAPPNLTPAETRQVRRAIAASVVAAFRLCMMIAAALAILASASAAACIRAPATSRAAPGPASHS